MDKPAPLESMKAAYETVKSGDAELVYSVHPQDGVLVIVRKLDEGDV